MTGWDHQSWLGCGVWWSEAKAPHTLTQRDSDPLQLEDNPGEASPPPPSPPSPWSNKGPW